MTNNRRQVVGTTTCETADITTTTTTTNTATTPTTSALLKESRQLLLKQQLKLKLNINVSEMMDNIRRNNVDDKQQTEITKGHDGLNDGLQNEEFGYEKDLNKLDTVTTVPQLQQKFNKFNIIDEAANKTNITTKTTSSKPDVAAATTSSTTTLTSSSLNRSLTQQQQQNTALAKFNRIIDNTVPVTNTYNYQQHVAETLTAKSSQQHPHYPRQQQHEHQEMPILSDSLKRRLANKNHQQYYSNNININNYNDNSTDLIVNNSKINFSSTTAAATKAALSTETAAPIATAGAGHSLIKSTAIEVASTSKAAANKIAGGLAKMLPALASSSQQEQELETLEKIRNKSLALEEDEQMERNDVHYLLKQLNSFSDIEEIEIVDMKQKQRQLQQQQQEQQQYIKEKQFVKADNNQQQHVEKLATFNFTEYQHQHVDSVKQQHVVEQVLSTNLHTQHVSTEHLVTETQKQQQQQQVVAAVVDVGLQMYTTESKQHYHETTLTSPTATSLVIYSPSSQSHKGIRRYASQDEQNACGAIDSYHTHPHHHQQQPLHQQEHPLLPHHHHYLHHQPHYVHLPLEHCSADSMLDTASGQTASADPLNLQQFVDDYIFQSCHYLETNNFVANYRTAMVESSSHEFRPSTTTTTNTTRTSNEEFYEEEEAGYVEDHSSAHSFELHEIEPPTVICKAPAPLPATTMQQQTQHHHQEYIMETRLCSSGVQTDLTASSLAQSFSLSSSLSSSEKQKRRQPLFKCCYTPLDRWREKRSQQSQIQKRTKSATTTSAAAATTTATVKFSDKTIEHHPVQYSQQHHQQQFQQLTTKNTTVAIVGGPSYTGSSTAIVTSCIATTGSSSLATAITLSSSHTQSHHSTSQSHSQQTQSLSKNINNHHNNKNNDNAPYAV